MLCLLGCQTLVEQYQRDDRARTLLEAMHDAFDLADHEETLKFIKPDSKQAQVLTLMLRDVCSCGVFIQSYAKDSEFCTLSSPTFLANVNVQFSGKRTLKNIGGGAEKTIEDLSAALVRHRSAFLNQVIITTEKTALQILNDVGIISDKVDRVSSQVSDLGAWSDGLWVIDLITVIELDTIIREIPYATGSRFTLDKGCLMGTRTAFLDFIVNWVNDPSSSRSLRSLPSI